MEHKMSLKGESSGGSVVLSVGEANSDDFYGKAQKYWSGIPATVNGMLGGLGYVSAIDIQGSRSFLRDLRDLGNKYALDCGAGIGRVSKNLLMPRFNKVDLVEQDAHFAQKAREYCTCNVDHPERLGEVYNVGLQGFCPVLAKYDLIWCQWVLGHLTEEDLLSFFERIRGGLTENGYLILKENVTSSRTVEVDDTDSSVTRPLSTYEALVQNAGYKIVKIWRQQGFPKDLYPVYIIACRRRE